MVPVGDQIIELTFTPNDTGNYDWSSIPGYNPETKKLDLKMPVSVVVDKSTWGDRKEGENGFVSYVFEDKSDDKNPMNGTTSIEITGTDGIYWLKETSFDVDLGRDTSTWYGIDNSSGIFEKGSRFSIRWINRAQNREEWDKLNGYNDNRVTQDMPDHKKWIFVAEVIHPDGIKKYEKLEHSVPLYVQLGDDWDEGDVEAYFLSESKDEKLNHEIVYSENIATAPIKGTYENGEDIYYAKLELLHFSPYTIYDKDPVDVAQNTEKNDNIKNENKLEEKQEKNNSDIIQEKNDGSFRYYYLALVFAILAAFLVAMFILYKKHNRLKKILKEAFASCLGKKILK